MRRARPVARVGDSSCVYTVSVGKPERKITLARPSCRWKDDIILIWIWIMWIFKEKKERAKTGFTWLRRDTSDEFLWTSHWTFWFHKTQGIWLAEAVLASGSDPRSCKTSLQSARNSLSFSSDRRLCTSIFTHTLEFSSTSELYMPSPASTAASLITCRPLSFSILRAFCSFYSSVTSLFYLLMGVPSPASTAASLLSSTSSHFGHLNS